MVGATLKLWGGASDSGCCSVADVEDARRVAEQLGLVHHVFNFAADFEARVVDPYVAATPRAARPTRASSATGTSSSTGCSSGPALWASTRWPPATMPAGAATPDGTWRLLRGARTRPRTSPTCWPCSARTSWPAPCSRWGR